jgi:amino acid permease
MSETNRVIEKFQPAYDATEESGARAAGPPLDAAFSVMPEAVSTNGKKRERPVPSIDELGSVALITNNISGPAMMGLPHLFHTAGIIPTAGTILAVCCCSSLCGTLLADTIQRIPGNRNFTKNINFSSAFRIIVGEDWYVFAETLFILSCMVQACASIVETAQSLDGFLASFVLGKTWAVQILPQPAFLQWSPEDCKPGTEFEVESGLEDCTPFHDAGDLVLTLGFALTTLIFYPLGRGHLQETIVVQIISFATLFVLLSQFYFEFWERGYDYVDTVPWFGTDFSQLAGVVLFNYAFSITVPSWLSEKMPHVSVNKTIWTSTILSSGIYISFGILAACSFENAGPNMLILLSSSQVHFMTRICAAIFGTSIIGCGVPVFCVIIKTALYSGGVCSKPWSQFFGALFPYCLSWMLYQGTMLMTVLNWTGLLVNGMVAFILPLILALYASRRITANYHAVASDVHIELATTTSTSHSVAAATEMKKSGHVDDAEDNEAPPSPDHRSYSHSTPSDPTQVVCDEVSPLWECLEPARRQIIIFIVAVFALTIFATVAIDWFVEDEPTDRRRRRY